MNTEEIKTKVDEIIADQLGYGDPINMEDHAENDIGADSLDEVEMTMAFEEEFDIEISDEEAHAAKVVKDIVALIEKKLNEKSGA